MPHDRDPLLPFAGRNLSGAEAAELERLLEDHPDRRAEWERLQALSATLQAGRADGFASPIRSRVMTALRGDGPRTPGIAAALHPMFVRLEVAALVAIAGLAVHNLVVMGDPYVASWIERLLGVPGATLESLLLFGAM